MTVFLVGAGPGAPGLLTLRGAELLAEADVVVHDRLVGPGVLRLINEKAEIIDAGKEVGDGATTQQELNDLLIDRGRSQLVVRLKGGDPFVFGRGGEEAAALGAAGVDYEVVPGVSSISAVPALAGVPLTMRGLSSAFVVVTGHDPAIFDDERGDLLARVAECAPTIVVLMGVATRAEIARRLVAAGRAPSTPVLVVERGTTPDERVVRTDLAGLGSCAVSSPATIVIGEVAALDLTSSDRHQLNGWRVVVTRAAGRGDALAEALQARGAHPIELPALSFEAPDDDGQALAAAAANAALYDWVVCTSPTAVRALFAELRDARDLGGVKVAAVGPGTADAFAAHGIVCDLVPETALAEALVAAFPRARPGGRVLVPRAAVARDVVPDGLNRLGYRVDVVEAYRTVVPELDEHRVSEVADADAVLFASSSAVTGFVELCGVERCPPVVVTIGPVTSATARAAGLGVAAEAAEHTITGLVEALVQTAAAGARPSIARRS